MTKPLVISLILILLATALGWADAGDRRGDDFAPCYNPAGWHGPFLDDLSDAQRQALQELQGKKHVTLQPLREALRQADAALQNALESDNPEENRVRRLAREKADRLVDLLLARRDFRTKMEAIFTPEQLTRLEERREWKRGHHREHGQHHGCFETCGCGGGDDRKY